MKDYRALFEACVVERDALRKALSEAAKLADEREEQDERDNGAAASGAAQGLGDLIRELAK